MPTLEWVAQTSPVAGEWFGIAKGPDRWIAVGNVAGAAAMIASTDGHTWTSVALPEGAGPSLRGCAYANGQWVAVGLQRTVLTSTNGVDWTTRSSGNLTYDLFAVAYGAGRWVAVGSHDLIFVSDDNGTTWSALSGSPSSTTYWYDCAYGNGKWITVGSTRLMSTSVDGTTWTAPTQTDYDYRGVSYANGQWVRVGAQGAISTSIDGTAWVLRVQTSLGTFYSAKYGNNQWAVVGTSGATYTSADTITWSTQPSVTSYALNEVAYGDLQWVTVGSGNTILAVLNRPPAAPILLFPANGAAIDRLQAQVFQWQFTDPDVGDSQSAYNYAYRLTGAAAWTETGWVSATLRQHTIAGDTLPAGDYEWRVAVKDSQGLVSPWSVTGFFTASTVPPGPSITDPANGATIATPTYPVVWSAPNQDAYQLQVLAADGTTILYDTGQVNSTTARSREVDFPDNQTTRIIRVSVLYGGLWSPWSTATVTVSYTPPPVPWLTATPVDVGAGVPSAIRVDVEDPRLRVDARNRSLNPAAVATGYSSEYLRRFGWQQSWQTVGGPAEGPETFARTTPSTGSVGPGRGFDVYGNPDITPDTSGSWTQQPVTAGQPITFSVFARTSKDSSIFLRYRIHDGLGVWVSHIVGVPVDLVANEWQRVSITITPQVSGYAVLRIELDSTGWATTDWLDATGQMLEDGAELEPYFDGDTTDDDTYTYRWTGTPHASTSERLAYGTTGELAESTEPMVVAHDVWVRGGPEGEIRLAADLPASLPYLWHLPASGVEYEFRARAVGDNGTSSWSDWIS